MKALIVTVLCLLAVGCGKQMSGVYEMDMSEMMSQMGVPQIQGMPEMQQLTGGQRITFDGNRVILQMGLSEIRGTYKVKKDIIHVTAEGYGPNGQFPLYVVDDNTIKFGGTVFKKK